MGSVIIDQAFFFLAIFFILSVCWFTPLAGTAEAYHNMTKRFAIIAALSAVITVTVNVVL